MTREQPAQIASASSSRASNRVSSQWPGISVELVEFSKFQNTITLKIRLINAGEKDQNFNPSSRPTGDETSYLLDEATGTCYKGTSRASHRVSVPASGSVVFWTKYVIPEGDKPNYLTAILNYGILLEHLAVP